MSVAVLTGSQACIPEDIAKGLSIQVLPYTLQLDGQVYRDGVDITSGEFYRLLPNLDKPAQTSAISPGAFLKAFEELSAEPEGILVITISRHMSTTYANALIASESFNHIPVIVLDSNTAAMAQGLVVMEAARAAMSNTGLDDCARVAREACKKVELLAYIDTFEYLRRSGRVNFVKAFAATALSIKPVFRFKDGEAVLIAKKRSTQKAREYIIQETEKFFEDNGPLRLSIFHADALEDALALSTMMASRIETNGEVTLTEFTPVMGSHTGPGVVGAAFL